MGGKNGWIGTRWKKQLNFETQNVKIVYHHIWNLQSREAKNQSPENVFWTDLGAWFSVQCARFSVQFWMCSVPDARCSVQCAWFSVQFAGCNVQGTVCRVQCAGCSVQSAEYPMQCVPPREHRSMMVRRGTNSQLLYTFSNSLYRDNSIIRCVIKVMSTVIKEV